MLGPGLCRWPLRLGYFVLKNPSQVQLGMDFASARTAEASFFATAHPWSALPQHSSRFGAASLRSSLSRLMAHLISRSLPGLLTAAQQQLADVRGQVRSKPVVKRSSIFIASCNPASLFFLCLSYTSDLSTDGAGGC